MSQPPPSKDPKSDSVLDPVFVSSRRELIVMLVLFAVFCVWAVGVSYWAGYGNEATVSTTFGLPTWVFWGVLVPWAVVDVVGVWYCFAFMKDDELE